MMAGVLSYRLVYIFVSLAWSVALMQARRYEDYSVPKVPHYGDEDVELSPPDDYREAPPEFPPAANNYKYDDTFDEENSRLKNKNIGKKNLKKQRSFKNEDEDTDDAIYSRNKYENDIEQKSQYSKQHSKYHSRLKSHDSEIGIEERNSDIDDDLNGNVEDDPRRSKTSKRNKKLWKHQNNYEYGENKEYIQNNYEKNDKSSNRLTHLSKSLRRKPRDKSIDTSTMVLLDKDAEDYVSSDDSHRKHSDAEEYSDEKPLPTKHKEKINEDYSDMERLRSSKIYDISTLVPHHKTVPSTSEVQVTPHQTTDNEVNHSIGTTLASTPAVNQTTFSNEKAANMSLAELSKWSILKSQKKESNHFVKAKKPSVFIQVTDQTQTFVMLETEHKDHPSKEVQQLFDDSPSKLLQIKRLMRQNLIGRARSMSELTDNWDETICEYIDMTALRSKALTVQNLSLMKFFFLCVCVNSVIKKVF